MTTVVRAIGYTNSLQQLVWTAGNNIPVTAYLWGGGGGGGGNDSNPGGNGGGSGYSQKSFVVNEGDIITVGVGGAGGAGSSGRSGGPGGSGGAGYTTTTGFSSLDLLSNPINLRVTNGAYCSFLNQNGVWNYSSSATYFDQTTPVNFPATGSYTFTGSCDNYATIYVDGVPVLDIPGFQSTYSTTVQVSAGTHNVRLYGVNTGGPASIGLTISGGGSYCGGIGGASGGSGTSGAGGGGGAASIILLNSTTVAVAGGGGGGGGGGNSGAAAGRSAPGPRGQASVGYNAGQSGENKGGDGGGGGAGGGGWAGGQGGNTIGGDSGGDSGYYGSNLGDNVENPSATSPGGRTNQYWRGAGTGGTTAAGGYPGQIVLEFTIGGVQVNTASGWQIVNKTWANFNNVWRDVKTTWVKKDGVWSAVQGSFSPTFTNVSGYWGVDPRPYG